MVNVANYPLSIHLGGGTEGYGALEALLGGGGLVGAAIAARMLSPARAPLIVTVTFAVSGRSAARRARARARSRAGRDGDRGRRARARGRGRHDARPGAHRDAARSRVFAAQDGAAHAAYSAAMLAGGLLVGHCRCARGRRHGRRMRLRGGARCKSHAPG